MTILKIKQIRSSARVAPPMPQRVFCHQFSPRFCVVSVCASDCICESDCKLVSLPASVRMSSVCRVFVSVRLVAVAVSLRQVPMSRLSVVRSLRGGVPVTLSAGRRVTKKSKG